MDDYRVPKSHCTACGREHDAALALDSRKAPEPGSIMICIRCAHIMIFSDDLTLRDLTGEEAYEIAGNKTILAAVEAVHLTNKSHQ